jgi:hypothetical protein
LSKLAVITPITDTREIGERIGGLANPAEGLQAALQNGLQLDRELLSHISGGLW